MGSTFRQKWCVCISRGLHITMGRHEKMTVWSVSIEEATTKSESKQRFQFLLIGHSLLFGSFFMLKQHFCWKVLLFAARWCFEWELTVPGAGGATYGDPSSWSGCHPRISKAVKKQIQSNWKRNSLRRLVDCLGNEKFPRIQKWILYINSSPMFFSLDSFELAIASFLVWWSLVRSASDVL